MAPLALLLAAYFGGWCLIAWKLTGTRYPVVGAFAFVFLGIGFPVTLADASWVQPELGVLLWAWLAIPLLMWAWLGGRIAWRLAKARLQ